MKKLVTLLFFLSLGLFAREPAVLPDYGISNDEYNQPSYEEARGVSVDQQKSQVVKDKVTFKKSNKEATNSKLWLVLLLLPPALWMAISRQLPRAEDQTPSNVSPIRPKVKDQVEETQDEDFKKAG